MVFETLVLGIASGVIVNVVCNIVEHIWKNNR